MAASNFAMPVAVEFSTVEAWAIWEAARNGQDYSRFANHMASETNMTCGGRHHSKATVVSCPWPGPPRHDTEDGQKMMLDMNLRAVLRELIPMGVDSRLE